MRLICLEEHTMDAAVGPAAADETARQAPYLRAIGQYQDDPRRVGDRPGLTAFPVAIPLAKAPLEDRLATMDAHGIDMQVVSLSDLTQWVPVAQAADVARGANDRLADVVARHPDRFGAFSTLPWQDPEAAVREAERCAAMGFRATLLNGRAGLDTLVDDARYEPILAKLSALGTVLYIHPGPPLLPVVDAYYAGFAPEVSGRFALFGWGWHHEAGIQVLRLILSGALDRHRGLRIVSGHWGEMVPFYLQRLDDAMPPEVTGLSRTIGQTYRDQVWVTPSGMLNRPHFDFLRTVCGADRIMFSVDYPYLTMTGARTWLEGLDIPEAERHAIAHGNAETLLGIKAT